MSGSGDARSLFRARLVERPRLLASDRLVIIVPRANPAGIRAIHDLHIKEAKLVVAGPNVPEGASTRQVLRRIGLSFILQNAVSVEPAAKRVVAKVAAGQADAGFVYATDARAAGSRVRTVAVPPYAQPAVPYEIAVLRSSTRKAAARAWVERVTQRAREAGLPPGRIPVTGSVPRRCPGDPRSRPTGEHREGCSRPRRRRVRSA